LYDLLYFKIDFTQFIISGCNFVTSGILGKIQANSIRENDVVKIAFSF